MVKSNRDGDGVTRSSKRDERVGDLTRTYFTRSLKMNTPYLTKSSTKNRRIDGHTRSSKKNKRSYPARRSTKDKTICNEGETTGLPIPVHGEGLNEDRSPIDTVAPVHGDGLNEDGSPIDTVAPVHGDGLNEDQSPIDTVAPVHGDGLNEDQSPIDTVAPVHGDGLNEDLESLGYPERPKTMLTDCILVNSFEEPFGDTHDKGVWSELKETVATNIDENTVALASFNGEKRFFACTGCFIEWNGCTTILTSASLIRHSRRADEILKNLRIEVFLPSKERASGILQHYNLHYNIALVRVNDYSPSHPIKIQHRRRDNREVLAVGRIFTSGELMASRGHKDSMVCEHDCGHLHFSRCRISKAGIGGPLLDFDGKFVGMNFYDKRAGGTWYLKCNEILHVLGHFEKKKDC
ncbi:hypothetical protein BDA96_03G466000 [Sorghum bicolor]|uniref:Uncharacterized protein n=2 Tax=Sorghum bicolor TaxID=4558 RepID=A0A1B6Q8A8_SORBI|nr:uncharacterized protein LOC8077387 isoform X2 [Sorghum bicolor]KAG0541090.1 hypothetical protein BDA96_03G466000 [Sorghum bicolor]KXG34159.1 hypothetical protein SORBI_3003G433400 [Sorghum bicolor]KXG34160.1 hypothetical protein SORBI_3003G433400 [Sorghum bicolor]KXG34162.1 hypothetical protein SORBI_3003G433400 [Sorghum bicolor]|eukprot:XP_021313255.1 uncharacterized protein LOC8077387 isoform X2 [Sorghum bicolor]